MQKDNENYFSNLCDSFSLKNFMTGITCIKSSNNYSIDVLLTNEIRSFQLTVAFESGLSDCHKWQMIRTFFRAYFKKFPQKNIEYWISKNLYKDDFLNELDFEFSRGTIYKYKGNQYDILTNIPRMVLGKHALIKIKKISLNHAPLM